MNDTLRLNHLTAGKIAEAVWGSKSYSKEFKPIELLKESDTNEARNHKVFNTLRAKGLI